MCLCACVSRCQLAGLPFAKKKRLTVSKGREWSGRPREEGPSSACGRTSCGQLSVLISFRALQSVSLLRSLAQVLARAWPVAGGQCAVLELRLLQQLGAALQKRCIDARDWPNRCLALRIGRLHTTQSSALCTLHSERPSTKCELPAASCEVHAAHSLRRPV